MALLDKILGRLLEAIAVPLARENYFRLVRLRFDHPLGHGLT